MFEKEPNHSLLNLFCLLFIFILDHFLPAKAEAILRIGCFLNICYLLDNKASKLKYVVIQMIVFFIFIGIGIGQHGTANVGY